MELKFNIFRLLVMVLLLSPAAILSSCSESEPVAGDVTGEDIVNVSVNFNFTVSDTKPDVASRASSGGYEPGQGFENYVNVADGDIRVYLFTTDNKFFGTVSDMVIIPRASSGNAVSYYVDGKISAEMARLHDFKVCILANWKQYPDLKPGDDLQQLWSGTSGTTIYDFDNSPLSESHTIPFYGIKAFSNVAFADNENTFLGEVFLLRAYAKIEINLDSTVAPLRSVTIRSVNRKGYKAPKDVDAENKYIHHSYEDDWVNVPNIVQGCGTQDIVMTPVLGDPGKAEIRKFVAYVPEYDNTSAWATKSYITLDFVETRPIIGNRIDFKYYEATGPHAKNDPFNLLRNYIYRYDVSLDIDVIINLQYVVCPWESKIAGDIIFD